MLILSIAVQLLYAVRILAFALPCLRFPQMGTETGRTVFLAGAVQGTRGGSGLSAGNARPMRSADSWEAWQNADSLQIHW
jgi:hypothetical protein